MTPGATCYRSPSTRLSPSRTQDQRGGIAHIVMFAEHLPVEFEDTAHYLVNTATGERGGRRRAIAAEATTFAALCARAAVVMAVPPAELEEGDHRRVQARRVPRPVRPRRAAVGRSRRTSTTTRSARALRLQRRREGRRPARVPVASVRAGGRRRSAPSIGNAVGAGVALILGVHRSSSCARSRASRCSRTQTSSRRASERTPARARATDADQGTYR